MAKSKSKPKGKRTRPATSRAKYAKVTRRTFAVADLEPAPYNPRSITSRALAGLSRSLETFGLLALPIVNVAEGKQRLVGGHQRHATLLAQGVETIECVVVEFDEETERQANFTLNNEEIEGRFIPELTRELLDQIQTALPEGSDLFRGLNFDSLVRRVNRLVPQTPVPPAPSGAAGAGVEDEEVPTVSTRTTAASKLGAYYAVGAHVIHCGPPVRQGSLQGFPVARATMGFMEIRHATPSEAYLADHLGRLISDTDGALFVATDESLVPVVQRAFVQLGGHWSTTLLWLYPDAEPTEGKTYAPAFIPVIYGWREGAKHVFYGGKAEGNVFNLTRAPARAHTPVEVVLRAMQFGSDAQGWVFDPEAGHGASLIAAERLGRRLLGYVRTTRECDRLRKRWAEFVHGKGADWRALTTVHE